MSNVLMDAIVGNIAGQMDGQQQTLRKAVDQFVDGQKLELVERQAQTIGLIEQKLKVARDNNAEASVIAAYEKLLAKATA